MKRRYYVADGDLMDYDTADVIRPATEDEESASTHAARHDGGAGVIGDDDLTEPVAGIPGSHYQVRSVS